MDALRTIADRHGLFLPEDAAEAHGAWYHGRPRRRSRRRRQLLVLREQDGDDGRRRHGDHERRTDRARRAKAARPRLLRRAALLAQVPRLQLPHDESQAAVGLTQTERLAAFVEARRTSARRYAERLSRIPGLTLPVEQPNVTNVFWMYGVLTSTSSPGRSPGRAPPRDRASADRPRRGEGPAPRDRRRPLELRPGARARRAPRRLRTARLLREARGRHRRDGVRHPPPRAVLLAVPDARGPLAHRGAPGRRPGRRVRVRRHPGGRRRRRQRAPRRAGRRERARHGARARADGRASPPPARAPRAGDVHGAVLRRRVRDGARRAVRRARRAAARRRRTSPRRGGAPRRTARRPSPPTRCRRPRRPLRRTGRDRAPPRACT